MWQSDLFENNKFTISYNNQLDMKPIVSIIMGSTSDLPILKKAADFLNKMEVPFEMNALSAHRTPREVEEFATNAEQRGIKVIIAAGGASWRHSSHDPATCHRHTC